MTDSNYVDQVRTVTLYKNGVELEQPVLLLGSDDRLLLRFDILGAETDNYHYRIRHCNSRWQIDNMEPYEFVNGFDEGTIDDYNPSFTTLTDFVNYYHYLPEKYSQLLISGNYVVIVTPQDYPDSVLFTRRFCVTEETAKTVVEVTVPYNNEAIRQRREVDVTVESPYSHEYLTVMVRQNGREDLLRELPFAGYDGNKLCYRHRPENIFAAGNTFRWFDISNLRTAMYNVCQIREFGGEIFAILCPLEDHSNRPFITETVLNGGMKVNVWDRSNKQTEADYVYVNFALPRPHPFMDGEIYVVGDLTQWHLNAHSRMEYNFDIKAYTLRLQLKQGYYSYQLLFLPTGTRQGLTATLEGDHYETTNDYYVWVYCHEPSDRYDRLVGFKKVNN